MKLPTLSPDKTDRCLADSSNLFVAAAIFGKRAAKIRENQSWLLLGTITPFIIGFLSFKHAPEGKLPPL